MSSASRSATETMTEPPAATIARADEGRPILTVVARDAVAIRAGTVIHVAGDSFAFDTDEPVPIEALQPGADYGIGIDDEGRPFAAPLTGNPVEAGFLAGFHYAPAGNATGREGGDEPPAINPHSCWDLGFRPSCPDPRGMARVESPAGTFWADIYLLGTEHHVDGTSRCGATIADGRDLPMGPYGKTRARKLDFATAEAIYAAHGKRLLGAEEFFAAAYGVEERCARDDEPTKTGLLEGRAARHISRWGLFDVTGTMWQWGTDGDPDTRRPSIFGGSWVSGSGAGSRCAGLGFWPGDSGGGLSARGGSDHLIPV